MGNGGGQERLYDRDYIRVLFDDMASSYGRVNILTSFGFSHLWRRQCVARLELRAGLDVADWMTGMGEGWAPILRRIGRTGSLTAVDLTPGMLRQARVRRRRWPGHDIRVVEADVLSTDVRAGSLDAVVMLFGVKSLSGSQTAALAVKLARCLREGGRFSLIEVSAPRWRIVRGPFLFYLERVIPLLGRLLLGNPDSYRMLGVYTRRFGDCGGLVATLCAAGLEATGVEYFLGCATGVVGRRPAAVT
jgi:ubiquinone/menaquinone biosynthesis C-methylase UbiE